MDCKLSNPSHEKTISRLVEKLAALPNVQGVVLGGSRGLNLATETSDYDFAIFYEDGYLIDHESVAGIFGVGKETRLACPVDGILADIFYRDLTRVRAAVLDARQGKFLLSPDNSFPQGKLNLTSISYLVNYPILWERDESLSRVVSTAVPMANKLRAAMIEFALRGAASARETAKKARNAEVHESFLLSHCSLLIWNLEIALFAINSKYPVLSKQTMEILESQPIMPGNWRKNVHKLFAACVAGELALSMRLIGQLGDEVAVLADKQNLK